MAETKRLKIYQAVIVACVGVFFSFAPLYAKDVKDDMGITFQADFETGKMVGSPEKMILHKKGGALIEDGVSGKALRLLSGDYLSFPADGVITSEGTIMMWVRPHWGYYAGKENLIPLSHTFASFTWADNGYFVLSDGWWELAGSPYTYVVGNNLLKLHTHEKVKYLENEWMHLACSWKIGTVGFVKLFVNGKLVSEEKTFLTRQGSPKGQVFIGSDMGTNLSGGRFADSDIDCLTITQKALSELEIRKVMAADDPSYAARFTHWMDSVLEKPYGKKTDANGNIREIRAMFDEGADWMQPEKAEAIIQTIKKAGFNVYIPCIWHGRGARYNTDVALPDERRGIHRMSHDPLATLIDIAHKNGIEVHPWFCITLRQESFYGEFYSLLDTPVGAFDIHRPEFREFITRLVLDVVERYDVDGINLDYVRTMGFCKCEHCVELYRQKYGRNLVTDISVKPKDGRLPEHLQAWQDDAVREVVEKISTRGKKMKPGLIISVDGHPTPRIVPPNWQGRREILWANDGLVDLVFNMDYNAAPDIEKHDLVAKELKDPSKLIILLGNYESVSGRVISRNPETLGRLVGYAQRRWPGSKGVGVYLYSMLNDGQVAELSRKWFKKTAVPR